MSEELKDVQNETQPAESAPAAESKRKKINKLTLEMIGTKIKELEEKNQATSRYYKHLVLRKKEIEAGGN